MMKNQLAGLMKQAQAMQENMKKAQDAIAAMEVEGEAGGGMVKIVMTGRHDVKRVTIEPSLLAEDKDMLEDLVAAAINDAVRKVEAASQQKMARIDRGHAHAARIQASVLRERVEPLSSLEELTQALRCLPSVGPKAAQRMALHLLQHDREGAQRLALALEAATRTDPPLPALQYLHRGRAVRRFAGRASATRPCCAWSKRPPI